MTHASLIAPVLCVVGARPNYMKMAPVLRAFDEHVPPVPWVLVHTGQHYDHAMNERLFSGLRLPTPQYNLEVGSGTHAVQTAEIMKRFEPLVDDIKPSCVLVVGDVNSTLACALVAVKKHVAVVHVEAGLRSGDRAMPLKRNQKALLTRYGHGHARPKAIEFPLSACHCRRSAGDAQGNRSAHF